MTGERTEAVVGRPLAHDSAHLHVTGEARYTDDLREPEGLLHAAFGLSERAHAIVEKLDLMAVIDAPGVRAVVTAADVVGSNSHGPIAADDPIFVEEIVSYFGQPLFAVVADSPWQARDAARRARVSYADRSPVLDIADALEAGAYISPSRTLQRGSADLAIRGATHRLSGRFAIGGQDHFYLECQVAVAMPDEDGTMRVFSATQHPADVQKQVAGALAIQAKDVIVECRQMGGGFGGKETQPALVACAAALCARRTGHPVKLRLTRDEDMVITGNRHEFLADYEVGFDDSGRVLGLRLVLSSRCGHALDLSDAVNMRAMCHCDNAYFLEHLALTSHRLRTHTASNTAFRGFGAPQAILTIENIVDDVSRSLGRDPAAVRQVNLYGGSGRDVTPYLMRVEDNVLPEMIDHLLASSDYADRRRAVDAFNTERGVLRKGLALTPVKFGISFIQTHLNQAGALVHVYTDGTVVVSHGGTEMGQGLYTKVAQVVAEELQLDISHIRCLGADTSRVPNASATAASASSDLNGQAAVHAVRKIKRRLVKFAAERYQVAPDDIRFTPDGVVVGARVISFGTLASEAHVGRIPLSATGFYQTPGISFDDATMTGKPFFYFAYGAAVSEVEVDTLTGEHRLVRVDILQDVGSSLNPALDRGQVEGGFMQGVGWLTSEELCWSEAGELLTKGPSSYKIPTSRDSPRTFNVELMDWHPNRADTVYRSKGVGEPPLMLAVSVFLAIKDAVASCGDGGRRVELNAPATPEGVLLAIEHLRD